jgi:hypothetical protein
MPRRPLSESELQEARLVFGAGFNYTQAYVFEDARWTDWVDGVGAALQKRKRGPDEHNAITLGNTSYFPIKIRTTPDVIAARDLRDIGWLMHELTHQWQYQRLGWKYLTSALGVQLSLGRASYDYKKGFPSREDALREARKVGRKLKDFNLEQQGDLARDFYFAIKLGGDPSPWQPFIEELR